MEISTLRDAIGTIIHPDAKIALYVKAEPDVDSNDLCFWRDEAWKLPDCMEDAQIFQIFSIEPKNIEDGGYIHIRVFHTNGHKFKFDPSWVQAFLDGKQLTNEYHRTKGVPESSQRFLMNRFTRGN